VIANRGEIAARSARSARALGDRVAGVYREAGAAAVHLDATDEALAIQRGSAAAPAAGADGGAR
jgi:acetyl/propionyl-CoA carboxylase alpha subunit